MNVLWPVFHDPSYRPSLAERLDFHWKANLRMLRQPRDIVLFSLISFAPLLLLVSFMRLFPDLFRAVSTPTNPVPDMAPLLFTTLLTFVVFLVLQHFAFVLAMNLTYAEQRALEIGITIAGGAEVILLDEPTSALDPISTAKVEDLIDELKRDFTIVIVTHNMQQAARVADRTAFLYLGNLIEEGPTSMMFNNPKDRRTLDYITGRFG